jgi:hypothetical protein
MIYNVIIDIWIIASKRDMNQSPKRSLNPMLIFSFFINRCYYSTYEMGIFGKLADNEPSGCRPVVHINSLKGGHLGGICAWLSAILVGWWAWSKSFLSSLA